MASAGFNSSRQQLFMGSDLKLVSNHTCDSRARSAFLFVYLFMCVCMCVRVYAGQVMTAGIAEILNGYSLKAVLRRVPGEKHTRAAEDTHDDSYLGNVQLQNKHTDLHNDHTLHYIHCMQFTQSTAHRVNFPHMSSCAMDFSL